MRISRTTMAPATHSLCLLRPAFASAGLSAWRIGGQGGAPWSVSPMAAPGNWANPEATAASFTAGHGHSGALGEPVHAVVHVTSGNARHGDDAALRAFCAARLADDKLPETITWRDEPLPRYANGKPMKRLLRTKAT